MSVLLSDLKFYGSATMADDDTTTAVGGAIDTSKKIMFTDLNGLFQVISSNSGDTIQTITVHYRDTAGVKQNEVKTLNGTTAVTYAATMALIMKAIKSATTTGDVAVEAQTAERSNTAQSGTATTIVLDASASAVDDFYNGMLIRLTGGTGSGQIREIYDYIGASKTAYVDRAWGTNPDVTSTFRIAKGVVFEKSPVEIYTARRLYFDATANTAGGATKKFYDKFFIKNAHGSLSLTSAQIKEITDASGLNAFALETTLDGTGTNGGGNNRLVAPVTGVGSFDSTDKNVATGTLSFGTAQGVWGELTLAGGATRQQTTWKLRITGGTI